MACTIGVIYIGIKPTAHRKSPRFHLKNIAIKKNVVFYFLVLHHFLAKFKYEKRLKKLKSSESELKKNSSKTLKSLKTGI